MSSGGQIQNQVAAGMKKVFADAKKAGVANVPADKSAAKAARWKFSVKEVSKEHIELKGGRENDRWDRSEDSRRGRHSSAAACDEARRDGRSGWLAGDPGALHGSRGWRALGDRLGREGQGWRARRSTGLVVLPELQEGQAQEDAQQLQRREDSLRQRVGQGIHHRRALQEGQDEEGDRSRAAPDVDPAGEAGEAELGGLPPEAVLHQPGTHAAQVHRSEPDRARGHGSRRREGPRRARAADADCPADRQGRDRRRHRRRRRLPLQALHGRRLLLPGADQGG